MSSWVMAMALYLHKTFNIWKIKLLQKTVLFITMQRYHWQPMTETPELSTFQCSNITKCKNNRYWSNNMYFPPLNSKMKVEIFFKELFFFNSKFFIFFFHSSYRNVRFVELGIVISGISHRDSVQLWILITIIIVIAKYHAAEIRALNITIHIYYIAE